MKNARLNMAVISVFSVIMIFSTVCFAVTSKTTRQSTAAVFLEGETDNITIGSQGTISLSRQARDIDLGDLLDQAWIINSIVTDSKGNTYIATSPNGRIVKYSDGKAEIIYPIDQAPPAAAEKYADKETQSDEDPNSVEPVMPFVNVHVFALGIDKKDRLLAGISGDECKLIRFENGKPKTILQPEDSSYIHDIEFDRHGNIYIATGPNGIVYRLGPAARTASVVYDSEDKNILTLVIDDNNFVYAGSDTRGLVYKIHPFSQTASVLFDSTQQEITDLMLDRDNNLYATATSAQSVSGKARAKGVTAPAQPGRPDTGQVEPPRKKTDTELTVANTDESKSAAAKPPKEIQRGSAPKSAGHIYKIDPKGFVTNVFSDMAIFFSMAMQDGNILLATGNEAELFSIDAKTEQKSIAYEDKKASQITALDVIGDKVLMGTANPAKLVLLSKDFAVEGTFISDLVDAVQPARWGKLQVDAEIPEGAKIMLQSRSGNVKDPNDPTFSKWSKSIELKDATQLNCPIARFCQYKLILSTTDVKSTPEITQVAVPHVIPNLAPKINFVKTTRLKDPQKKGVIAITFAAVDDNKDILRYKIEFRKLGRNRWIKLKDKLDKPKFEWNTKTVEDARYEVRITASDAKSNTTTTALEGSRLSDPFVVDNTAPVIVEEKIEVNDDTVTLKLKVQDEFTAIGNVSYTVNSSEDFNSTLPDDMIYDTKTEEFTILINDLKPGEHVISVRISDDIKNTRYKSYGVTLKGGK